MRNRVVEIASEGAHLSVHRGFLKVKIDGEMTGQIAIDDMGALIIRGHGASFSANICARLSQANIPIVICGTDQAPTSVIWPVSGHFSQGLHMQAQASTNKPLCKRLWAQLVRVKIESQASVLASFGLDNQDLKAMARRVKSGDGSHLESQAARLYWPRIMGEHFRRERTATNANKALNYGYMVLRAATARSILGAGLHPSLSLYHQSRGDAFCLADDLMEPFRPWVDRVVRSMIEPAFGDAPFDLTKERKAALVGVLSLDLQGPMGASPLQTCMDRLSQSLVQVFMKERQDMVMPGQPVALMIASGK